MGTHPHASSRTWHGGGSMNKVDREHSKKQKMLRKAARREIRSGNRDPRLIARLGVHARALPSPIPGENEPFYGLVNLARHLENFAKMNFCTGMMTWQESIEEALTALCRDGELDYPLERRPGDLQQIEYLQATPNGQVLHRALVRLIGSPMEQLFSVLWE